ncbi:HPr kinase/phosphorylase [Brevundimonas subvibrioides]|uniref:HPr kinase/phosphorylase n=1 Tax=Brevundimonas subvibrioides TaxID=74313 RepID=UPI0022B4BCB1|nr:HPr kinase/phosphatase C-terminal domain-containing protein [Brevundimonas subvibrioides]
MTPTGRHPPLHATAITTFVGGRWRGALLMGSPGSGKSDLALRLVARGWRLVGDDYVHVWASGGRLFAAPVETIAGQIEARGLGILDLQHRPASRISLRVDCVRETVERLPEPQTTAIAGVAVAQMALDIRPASAVETLSLAISRL